MNLFNMKKQNKDNNVANTETPRDKPPLAKRERAPIDRPMKDRPMKERPLVR